MVAQVFTVNEVAERMRCSQSAVYRLIEDGRLRSFRIGKKGVRVTDEALDEYVRGASTGAPA